MRIHLAKFIVLTLAGLLFGWQQWPVVRANLSGPQPSHTGAVARGAFAAEQNCTACHNGALNADDGTVTVAVAPFAYSPNQEAQVTISAEQLQRHKFGFQGTALDELGRPAGQWIVTDRERTRVVTVATGELQGRSYIQHTFQGTEPTGENLTTWTMRWKAPVRSEGRITLYFAVNAANNDARTTGDSIYTRTVILPPATALPAVATVSAASYFLNTPLAPDSIGVIFGANLTNATAIAAVVPLPTTLADAQVRIRDAAGVEREAPLIFVSPGQINFIVPAQTGLGNATVNVRLQGVTLATGTITVARAAPGLFSANANGADVAAAVLLRIKPDGAQSYENVARFNETTRKFEPLPIDLGAADDQLFLVLFGTGARAATTTGCTIGGLNAGVLFAGPQGLAGLDQINVRLPRALMGHGNVNIAFRADNQNANVVTINVR